MNKIKFLIISLHRKSLLVVVSILLLTPLLLQGAPASRSTIDKQQVVRSVANDWISVGTEQYKRGLFKPAEQSLLRAYRYQQYLTVTQRQKLLRTLEKTRTAALERKAVLETIQMADRLLAEQGQPIKAKAYFEEVRDSRFLTRQERKQIAGRLRIIDNKLRAQKKETVGLYNRSVEFYNAGKLEKARDGFVKVARTGLLATPTPSTAEDYLMKIDNISASKDVSQIVRTESEPEIQTRITALVDTSISGESSQLTNDNTSYIERVNNRRRNILRSYTRAVLNDATVKVQKYLGTGAFDKAKETVKFAKHTIKENRSALGDVLFGQYSRRLRQLTGKIARTKKFFDQQ